MATIQLGVINDIGIIRIAPFTAVELKCLASAVLADAATESANAAAATALSYVGISPTGAYTNLAALQAAYQTGEDGVFVVKDTGHWYFWNGSAWEDGGLYQSPLDVVQTTGTSETDVMSQKAVTDELATKASHGYESNPKTLKEVDDDLAQLASEVSNLNKPIATYTYDLNPEKTITSIDVETGTFTSPAHGLANGDMVSFAKNKTTLDAVNPLYFLPNGVLIATYYVINATTDTFQISTAIGGSALVMTSNDTMDLTKVHLEILSARSITISGLPKSGSYKANLRLNCTRRSGAGVQFRPSSYPQSVRWLTSTGSTSYGGLGYIDVAGMSVLSNLAVINAEFSLIGGHKNAIFKGLSSTYSEASLAESAAINLALSDIVPNSTADITSITVTSSAPTFYVLNGTTIEVYKL